MSEETESVVAEPWPVWWICRTGDTPEPGAFTLTPARALRLPLILAGASLLTGLTALVSGHFAVPLLLVLVHVPGVLRSFKRDAPDFQKGLRESEEFAAQSKLLVEVMKNSPVLADGYMARSPLLLDEKEFASFHRHPRTAWSRYAHFEVVERQENALIVRLAETPEAAHAYWNDTLSFVSGGWWDAAGASFLKRLEASAPMLGALGIFLFSLVHHGWRIDTVSAFCLWQAHLLFYYGLARLWRRVQAHDFTQHPNYIHLAFDLRAVSEADALARLNRHLSAQTGDV